MKVIRQTTLTTLAALTLVFNARAAADPLPSWNDGAAKRSIVDFVAKGTQDDNDAKSKIGTFPDTQMAGATKNSWTVISMKND